MGALPDQTPSGSSETVAWGPSTYAGYGVSAVAFVLAVIAFLGGDHSQQTLGVVVAGAIGGLSFAITQIGRYSQARKKLDITKAAVEAAGAVPSVSTERMVALVEGLSRALEGVQAAKPATGASTDLSDGKANAVGGEISREEWTGPRADWSAAVALTPPVDPPPSPDVDNSVLAAQLGDASAPTDGPTIPDDVPTDEDVAAALEDDSDDGAPAAPDSSPPPAPAPVVPPTPQQGT